MNFQPQLHESRGQPPLEGTLRVAFARSATELRAAQRLRHDIFAGEMGARLHNRIPGLDHDHLDAYCHHLFQAAIHARCPVQVIALRYPWEDGVHREVPFVGDATLLPHLWRLLGERRIVAELRFCAPLPTAGQTRDGLAQRTRSQILDAFAASAPVQLAVGVQNHRPHRTAISSAPDLDIEPS